MLTFARLGLIVAFATLGACASAVTPQWPSVDAAPATDSVIANDAADANVVQGCPLPDGTMCRVGATCAVGGGECCTCDPNGTLACTMLPCTLPSDAGTCLPTGATCRNGVDCCSGYCMPRGAPENGCATPPPGTIGCGEQLCDPQRSYCMIEYSDVPTPDFEMCATIPPACAGHVSCACATMGMCRCEQTSDNTLVFRCPGG